LSLKSLSPILAAPFFLVGARAGKLAEIVSQNIEISYLLRRNSLLRKYPMTEVWLRSNRRVLLLALVPAGLLGAIAAAALKLNFGLLVKVPAWCALAVSLLLIIGLLFQLFRPRVAYRQGHVLFYLKAGGPIAVPSKVVEAFFLGQGPANLPVHVPRHDKTMNLVARLSQRAPEWEQQETKSALGRWCDSYVTIRGTWCEPLSDEVLQKLNRRLAEAQGQSSAAGGKG